MSNCLICYKNVSNEIPLSSGGMIHSSCLQALQKETIEINNLLSKTEGHVNKLKSDLAKRDTLVFKVFSVLSKPEFTSEELEEQIIALNEKKPSVSAKASNLNQRLSNLYDFFTSYPPDWNERREMVVQRDGEQCYNCGNFRPLHLHHVTSLGRGGSNKVSNLRLLCERCHSQKHGGRNFSDTFRDSTTAFSKRIPDIENAIQQNRRISFGYRKPSQKGFKKRTIMPKKLVNFPHQHGDSSTLCVMGFCELRSADRTFALKRMRGLKVL